jgi:Tfp pilus assembly protein PilE
MKWNIKRLMVKNGCTRKGCAQGRLDQSDEAGLSSVEIVLVVLAGLILLAAAIVVYQKFQKDNELSDALSGLQLLTAGIEQEYQGQSAYTGLTPSLVINAHLAPSSFVSGTSLQNPWGGAGSVLVAPATQGYTITFNAVPQYGCEALGKQNMGNLLSVTINGTALTPNTGTPPDPANVDGACTSGTNTLVWNIN